MREAKDWGINNKRIDGIGKEESVTARFYDTKRSLVHIRH